MSNVTEDSSDSYSSMQPVVDNYVEYLNYARDAIYSMTVSTRLWSRNYDSSNVIVTTDADQGCPDSGIYMNHAATAQSANGRSSPDQVPSTSSSPIANGTRDLVDTEHFDQTLIGPFLHTLLVRLENITIHDFYSNLQLTGIISYLAMYPQPILRSFLLNNRLVFQPNAKSLRQALIGLQRKIDILSSEINKFDELRYRAKMFLRVREERLNPVRNVQEQPKLQQSRRNSSSSNLSAEVILNITSHPRGEWLLRSRRDP